MDNPFASRFANAPALFSVDQGERVSACLTSLAADKEGMELVNGRNLSDVKMSDDFWFSADDWRSNYRPYVVKNGILQIPVKGVLLHDFPWSFGGWATGYIYIWRAFERGMRDPEVKGIALCCDSPGGEVAGCFDLVDKMVAGVPDVERKPVLAVAAEGAYSAAYAIAAAADRIVVSRTGGVGSIGVLTSHVDVSKALSDAGFKITFIFAGAHKVDGNPYEALPAKVKARIQKRIDSLYAIFTESVATNRAMSVQAVRNTEALTYNAEDAISEGLADGIGNLEDSLISFSNELNGAAQNGDEHMTTTKTEPAAAALTHTQAQVDAAVADGAKAARAEGVTAERTRITAIMALPEAANRREAAFKMATTTDMTAEQVKGVLATLPETPAPKAESADTDKAQPDALAAAMSATGGGSGVQPAAQGEESVVTRILRAQNPDYVPKDKK